MFRRLPPLHALAAFEAAARHKSFSKAADELALTHSAVSHRIRQLEESLDTKLFLRLNRSVLLTPAGEAFLGTVRETLEKLQSASSSLSETPRTRLVVSAAPAMANNWLAHRIADFQAKHPHVELEIHAISHVANLRSGEADIGLRFGVGPSQWPGYECVQLFRDEIIPVCSPAYLERVGPFDRPADLARATLLRSARLAWKQWFKCAGLDWPEPTKGPLLSEVTLVVDAAASSAGVGLVPRIAAQGAILSGRVVRLFDLQCFPQQAYYAVCLPEKRERPEVALFIEWLLTEAKDDVYKGVEQSLRMETERLRRMVEHLPHGALLIEGENVTPNRAAESIAGRPRERLKTLSAWFRLLHGHRADEARRAYEEGRARGEPMNGFQATILHRDGTERRVEVTSIVHESGEVWLLHDVTDRQRAEERLQQLACQDAVTGLANRHMFLDRLEHAIARAKRHAKHFGVLHVHVAAADHDADLPEEISREAAERLARCVREEDTVARIGPQDFAVLVEHAEAAGSVAHPARRILRSLAGPFGAGRRRRTLTASVGISTYPADGEDPAELLRKAEMAVQAARRQKRNAFGQA